MKSVEQISASLTRLLVRVQDVWRTYVSLAGRVETEIYSQSYQMTSTAALTSYYFHILYWISSEVTKYLNVCQPVPAFSVGWDEGAGPRLSLADTALRALRRTNEKRDSGESLHPRRVSLLSYPGSRLLAKTLLTTTCTSPGLPTTVMSLRPIIVAINVIERTLWALARWWWWWWMSWLLFPHTVSTVPGSSQ